MSAAKADTRQDTSGWANICTRPVGPGVVCGQAYWYMARAAKRLTPDLAEEHVCRRAEPKATAEDIFGGVW